MRFIIHLIGHPMYPRNICKQVSWENETKYFNIFGFKTFFQGASARIRICFSKILSQPAERGVLESLEHTVFPKLLRTVETEVLVNDDVTVSDQSRGIRMFHCHLVSLVSVKCLSLL